MKRRSSYADPAQLGFDSFLADAETINKAAAFERTHGHLPATMDKALPYYRGLIERHHTSMLAGDLEAALALREEANELALRLNNGEPGILAGPDAPGCMLARLSAAETGTVPLWGQVGSFIIKVRLMRVRIDMDGMFGIGGRFMTWMNFSANAVDHDKPFLSETGYRSFLGLNAVIVPDLTPETFATKVIETHIAKELKGRLRAIEPRYRQGKEI
ncbi:hypothetical protein [Rhizobium sp. RU36D]|uniref:hypothetical protein n=1 Tax=Rhizobium sp. RU36D TaxID=1907415 RepID=UPI0009D8FD99|nr:hypothetical protein [Rhizobium sp. RU36D]SMD15103.1 hypothetical protein SAMN05880593_12727 [Rhizobium sp. RU36D]